MHLSPNILSQLHQTAINAATLAGKYIAASTPQSIEHKIAGSSDASQVVTEVDRESQRIIIGVLQASIYAYDLGLLAEEEEDDGSRLLKDYFWCVDPLDGTLPFIEGRAGYAVAISLIRKDGIPVIGVVYTPRELQCYSAVLEQGAFLNGEAFKPSQGLGVERFTILHHRSLAENPSFNNIIETIKEPFISQGYENFDLISHGGAIMNAIWCIEKQPAFYFALPKPTQGGGCIWDYAASVCLYNELGMEVSDYYGKPLHLNCPESIYMNKFGVRFRSKN